MFSYDDIDVHLLGRILAGVTDTSLANFALNKLFQPLGIWQDEQGALFPWMSETYRADVWHPFYLPDTQHGYLWTVDRVGYSWGSSGLQFTPREMAKFGYLYLKQGWWDGKEIVPAWYVQESLCQQITDEHGRGYGYLWWLQKCQVMRFLMPQGMEVRSLPLFLTWIWSLSLPQQ